MEITELIAAITEKHKQQGIKVHPPASHNNILALEKKVGFTLPADFKEFYSICSGFECEEDLFIMMPVEWIEGYGKGRGYEKRWFMFAEYMTIYPPHGTVSEQIRRMPDFVVKNKTTNSIHFIEVKYRSSEEFGIENLSKDYPYSDAIIIVVSAKHIKCLSFAELKEGKRISSECKNYLGYRNEFKLKKTVIVEYCNLANRLFLSI